MARRNSMHPALTTRPSSYLGGAPRRNNGRRRATAASARRRWCLVSWDGSAGTWVWATPRNATFNARDASGVRWSIQSWKSGRAVLTVTKPGSWDVAFTKLCKNVRAAKRLASRMQSATALVGGVRRNGIFRRGLSTAGRGASFVGRHAGRAAGRYRDDVIDAASDPELVAMLALAGGATAAAGPGAPGVAPVTGSAALLAAYRYAQRKKARDAERARAARGGRGRGTAVARRNPRGWDAVRYIIVVPERQRGGGVIDTQYTFDSPSKAAEWAGRRVAVLHRVQRVAIEGSSSDRLRVRVEYDGSKVRHFDFALHQYESPEAAHVAGFARRRRNGEPHEDYEAAARTFRAHGDRKRAEKYERMAREHAPGRATQRNPRRKRSKNPHRR